MRELRRREIEQIAQRAIAPNCAAHGPRRVQSLPCGWRATPVPSARVEKESMTRDANGVAELAAANAARDLARR